MSHIGLTPVGPGMYYVRIGIEQLYEKNSKIESQRLYLIWNFTRKDHKKHKLLLSTRKLSTTGVEHG